MPGLLLDAPEVPVCCFCLCHSTAEAVAMAPVYIFYERF